MQSDKSRLISSRSMLTGDIITIYVSPKRKKYQIHKGLLASYEHWKKRLDSKLIKGSQSMYLPECDPDIWDIFVNWLYRGGLKDVCLEDGDPVKARIGQYLHLYFDAEHWTIPALQNTIMDKFCVGTISSWEWTPCNVIQRIYQSTPKDSPLRCYVVDSFLLKSSLSDADCEDGGRAARVKLHLEFGNHEFVLECYEALMQLTPKSQLREPHMKTGCKYHKHESGDECSK